ncbi:hypothetical protein [Haloferula sp. BvORR071]|uniref:hypothetical protein n=1 Tax=Haloferula sp. BvORR071 TaxID=1396141 RepID=UPI000551F2F6|nr:hypothetical protein [Haloferula sp. BvORR071]
MDRLRGRIAEVLGADRVLLEPVYVGKYNRQDYTDLVEVRIAELVPPYLTGVPEEERMASLNQTVLGVEAAVQVRSKDPDGALVGKLVLEGVRFRGKRKRP